MIKNLCVALLIYIRNKENMLGIERRVRKEIKITDQLVNSQNYVIPKTYSLKLKKITYIYIEYTLHSKKN